MHWLRLLAVAYIIHQYGLLGVLAAIIVIGIVKTSARKRTQGEHKP